MSQKEEFIIKLNDQFSASLKKGEQSLDGARDKVDGLNEGFESLKRIAGGIGAAFAIDAIIDATKQFSKLQNQVMAYTGASSQMSAGLVSEAGAIADTYDVESGRVLEAANTMTKQMGGTLGENMDLILQGFRKGANVNGEFLDNLREYPAQFRAAGLSAAESIALITKGAKEGVYSDKAADTIKEMTLSLREMTQIQRDALGAIGVDANKLMNDMSTGAVTPFKAMQKIVGAMDGFDMAAQQTIIADIFKGAGEDAGVQFIKGLKDINLELDSVEQNSNGFNDSMLNLNRIINKLRTAFLNEMVPALSGFADWITNNIPLLKGIGAGLLAVGVALGIMKIAAIAATISTWSLNAALLANPIGLIIAGIALLVAGVVTAYNKFDTFKKIVDGVWEGIKILAGWIADFFIAHWDAAVFVVQKFIDVFRSIWPYIKNVMLKVGSFILKYHPAALLIRGLKKLFPTFFENLTKRFSKMFTWLKKMVGKIKKFFGFGDDNDLKVEHTEGETEESTQPTGSLLGGKNPAKVTATSAGNLKSGAGMTSMSNGAPKVFNINIDKLIENFTISTSNMNESRETMKNIVVETLLSGVNDIQTAIE